MGGRVRSGGKGEGLKVQKRGRRGRKKEGRLSMVKRGRDMVG